MGAGFVMAHSEVLRVAHQSSHRRFRPVAGAEVTCFGVGLVTVCLGLRIVEDSGVLVSLKNTLSKDRIPRE